MCQYVNKWFFKCDLGILQFSFEWNVYKTRMIIPVNDFIFNCCVGVFLIKFLFVSVYGCSNVVLLPLDEMYGGNQCKKKLKRKWSYLKMQNIEKYSMYKRCICEISMCIIKFKQFKMVSLFQHNHVIGIYHLQHHDAVNWCCWVVGVFFFLPHYSAMSVLCLSLRTDGCRIISVILGKD